MGSRSLGSILRCESHPDAALIEDHRAGDMICSQCGLVVGDRIIDVGSEWRTFANDKESTDMTRVGAAEDPTMDGHDLSTTIGRATGSAGFDASGNPLYRNRNTESASDKAKRKANREIKEMAERLSADQSIINSAYHIYHTVQKNKIIKGRSSNAIIAACMFIACRQQSCPRTFKEISAVSNNGTTIKDIGRCYKIIRKTLVSSNENSQGFSVSSSSDLIIRFCSKLDYSKEVRKLAESIVAKASDIPTLTGRSPNSLAAASIYLSADLLGINLRTAEEIGKTCGAAENTIKQTIKLMQRQLSKLLPTDFVSKNPSYANNIPSQATTSKV
jgi:transcription initiation factor TFIIB